MATCNVIIDLSHNNLNVDVSSAQADGIRGILHKASQGTGFADPAYAARREAAKNAGLMWGAYHFATAADPVEQARFFLRTASPGSQDLIVLDFETNEAKPSNTMNLDQAHAFIAAVQDATGTRLGLYGGAYLKQQVGSAIDPTLQSCWLWWSQYGPAPTIPPNWATWTLWQYTDGHHGIPPFTVDGIGPCDRNLYQGASDDLQARWVTGSLA
jgi:lysozyme